MKKIISVITAATLASIPLCSCGTAPAQPDTPLSSEPETVSTVSGQETGTGTQTPAGEETTIYDNETVRGGIQTFTTELFSSCYENKKGENALLSPFSVYTALAMLSNGAKEQTLDEITTVLCGKPTDPSQINAPLRSFMQSINEGEILSEANALFAIKRDDVVISDAFKTTVQNDYFAEIFCEPYDDKTADKINSWVNDKTKKMIPQIVSPESITPQTAAVLLNALAFEGEWEEEYTDDQVWDQTFRNYDASEVSTPFLHTDSECAYLENDDVTGFVRYYKPDSTGRRFGFAAMLPKDENAIDETIAKLEGETLPELINYSEYCGVTTAIPKFSFDDEYKLPDTLKDMGITSVFDRNLSDLSGLGETNDGTNLYVSDVIHKTHIELDEKGTKAAAATAVIIEKNDMMVEEPEHKEVILDRPFIFAIYDFENQIPVFIGTVCTL